MIAPDEYVIGPITVRGGRRADPAARKREPKEIGVRILDVLLDMGLDLAGDQRISVRRVDGHDD